MSIKQRDERYRGPIHWLHANFPGAFEHPAPHHQKAWDWVWALRKGQPSHPFVFVISRGHGKSTTAEVATAYVSGQEICRYGWYISGTQEQADEHVGAIGSLLSSGAFASHYPGASQPAVGMTGQTRGWRRNRLRTANGFTIDALGLDTAARGKKIDLQRPDWIVIDDIDDAEDSPATTQKRLRALTRKVLPARDRRSCHIFAVQNLVHERSIFSVLADVTDPSSLGLDSHDGDFLSDRVIVGPIPAVENLRVERMVDPETDRHRWYVTGGTPTWPEGFSLRHAEKEINTYGLPAFLSECQHEVEAAAGGIYSHIRWDDIRVPSAALNPHDIVQQVCAVDPAVSNSDGSDSYAIQADALMTDGRIWRRYSWESLPGVPIEDEDESRAHLVGTTTITASDAVIEKAIRVCLTLRIPTLVVETDQGGNTWITVYQAAVRRLTEAGVITRQSVVPRFVSRKAGTVGSKTERAQQMAAAYDRDEFRHVLGTHRTLEKALHRYRRGGVLLDLGDAAFWTWFTLTQGGRGHARHLSAVNIG